MERRLSAILAADMVGYSRLMEADETGTLARLKAYRAELIDPALAAFHGRIVKEIGDGILVEFPSVVEAVQCAVEIQREISERETEVRDDRRIAYRIGINLGDIIVEGEDIYGDGVNVAARLEALAEPGGLCISGAAYDQIDARSEFSCSFLGEQHLKNISRPIRAYQVSVATHERGTGEQPAQYIPDRPSIAVLPFDNMSGDPEQEYFSDGITEDIITDLSKVSGLFVIARNSTFVYKGKRPDIRQVCKELGVRNILEGSVRRAGDQVRINAQLIEGESGGHLWAERYDRNLQDIFSVQDEVTREIVNALRVALTPVERQGREERSQINPVAYDCFIRGRGGLYRFTAEATAEGRALLNRAIELDPRLTAVACAWLAISHCTDYVNGWNQGGIESLNTGLELAHRALAADDHESQAHRALALMNMWLRKFEDAERSAQRAIELDPNFAGAFATLGQIRDLAGHHENAIPALEQALRLDPKYDIALQFLGRAQFSLKRYDEAEAAFKRRLVEVPHSDMTRAFLASLYGHTGKYDDARKMWREILDINPDFTIERFRQVLPYDETNVDHFIEGLRKAGLTG